MTHSGPKIDDIRELQRDLRGLITVTPVIRCAAIEALLDNGSEVFAKMEFLQKTGTFKARGALATLRKLKARGAIEHGVTAVSAGNHAIATAFAAHTVGTTAKVVMMQNASPVRVAACEAFGAEVVQTENVHQAFELAKAIEDEEGRAFVHPFEGPDIALGTGTVGAEICDQLDGFDAIVIPVGGGGLISGMANAVKQLLPDAEVIGVEPEGADSMHRSFASGQPESIESVQTIADSLGAPYALPFSFELTRKNVDRLAMVSDVQLREAMGLLYEVMSIAVEPACVATTAALLGPLRESLQDKRVVLVMCGSNIDWASFQDQAIFNNAD